MQFKTDTAVQNKKLVKDSFCSNIGPVFYWNPRENSLELIEAELMLVSPCDDFYWTSRKNISKLIELNLSK